MGQCEVFVCLAFGLFFWGGGLQSSSPPPPPPPLKLVLMTLVASCGGERVDLTIENVCYEIERW